MTEISARLIASNFGYLALVWGVAVGAITLFWVHPASYTFAISFLLLSARQQALLNCEHECIHGKFVRSRRLNDLIGTWLCAAPVGSPYGASRARHLSHHRLLSTPEDPDRALHAGEAMRTRAGLAKHFIGGVLGAYAGMILLGPRVPAESARGRSHRRDFASIAVCQVALAAVMTVAVGWWVYPALWLAPLLTATTLWHLVRSFAEHAITQDESAMHNNRLITIHSNLLERGLVAPYYMNYHAEHHLVPTVPALRLKRMHGRLAGRTDLPPLLERPSYAAALVHYVRALRD
jgi:fatty acid desaturase